MPAYLVRLTADMPNPGDLVGVFVAKSVLELDTFVDECCESIECEYVELPSGGITLPRPAMAVPVRQTTDDGRVGLFNDSVLSDSWLGFFVGDDSLQWTALADCPWNFGRLSPNIHDIESIDD